MRDVAGVYFITILGAESEPWCNKNLNGLNSEIYSASRTRTDLTLTELNLH